MGVELLDALAEIPGDLFEALGKSFPVLDIRALRLAVSGHLWLRPEPGSDHTPR